MNADINKFLALQTALVNEKARLEARLSEISKVLGQAVSVAAASSAPATTTTNGKRTFSAATRAKMKASQQARWAKKKATVAVKDAVDAAPAPPKPAKPNLVIILADDLGYGDVSCYGATKLKTPNIDRLAREGMKFTDAHTAATVCSPSRYGLMTGRSPWRLHKKGNGYSLETGRMTMASLLKSNGYRSAAIGKWHLGYSKDWNKLPITGPLEVVFDYHFGVPQNHNDSARCFIENHDIVGRKVAAKGPAVGRNGGAHVPWGALMFVELPKAKSESK